MFIKNSKIGCTKENIGKESFSKALRVYIVNSKEKKLHYLSQWKAAVTSSFLFFRNYPKVTPGSQIIVPEKPEVKKMSAGEFVSIAGFWPVWLDLSLR